MIAVNDAKKKVTVRMGISQGVIAFEDMQWARKPDLELAYYEAKIKNPSEALAVGDVILVRVKKEKNEDKDIVGRGSGTNARGPIRPDVHRSQKPAW